MAQHAGDSYGFFRRDAATDLLGIGGNAVKADKHDERHQPGVICVCVFPLDHQRARLSTFFERAAFFLEAAVTKIM